MSNTLVDKAVAVARLMELSSSLGGAAEVKTSGEVWLTTTAGDAPRRIGGSVSEAVAYLEKLHGEAALETADGVSA